jgi:molecular chaperone HscA
MALLQISEPGQSPDPHQRKHAVGIDLGTTNSLVAAVRNGNAQTLPDFQGRHLLPSVVRYRDDAIIVGADAKAAAAADPLNTISSVKRLMGRAVTDVASLSGQLPYEFAEAPDNVPRIITRRGEVTPVEVSAEILRVLAEIGEKSLGDTLDGVVITVPAYFDDAQRQATKDAARLADLHVLRLLNEPTAAALAYGLDKRDAGIIAVYDLGGGTFDISILNLHEGVFEVLATGGDSGLGGDDFDLAIGQWILQQAQWSQKLEATALRQVIDAACAAKEALTSDQQADIDLSAVIGWRGTLDRFQFEALVDPLIERSLKACRRSLRDAHIKVEQIVSVVMVGGSTRVPRVREQVGKLFGQSPLTSIDPDRVVAIGAAIQADVLVGNRADADMLLLDVTPLSLGIETMGGLVEKIIRRNSTIPVAMAQEFTTYKDGQTALAIHVVQGERELVADCRSLARFELRGIPPMAAGAARIRVTFQVDADGMLQVSAKELVSGVESHIVVKPSYGLDDEAITRMLQESYSHAQADREQRALLEQQVDCDRLLETMTAAIEADGATLLSESESTSLAAAMKALLHARNTSSASGLKQAIEELAKTSEFFAARRMDKAIKAALSGHRLEEFDEGNG